MILSKWYCDCVSDAGDAFIGYWARLKLGIVTIPYAACVVRPAGASPRQRLSFRPSPEPKLADGQVRWACRSLGVRGIWDARVASYERTLFASPHGWIRWQCHVPRARARVDLADTAQVSGLGYAEHLVISLRPSALPFDELRWGRFLSPDDVVIWIEWRGETPRQWIWHNGTEMSGACITRDRVELPAGGGALELYDPSVLRDGPLAATALPRTPGAALLVPRTLRNARETKWLVRGTLETAGRASSGWVIHELVRWR